jgi:DNA-binding beta-propeller fold protein YncE
MPAARAVPGHRDWVARYTPGAHPSPRAIVVSPDGPHVYLTATVQRAQWIIAYDAVSGTEVWRARSSLTEVAGFASDIAMSPDGAIVYATGGTFADPNDWDYASVAYDAATGAELWTSRYDGPAHYTDQPSSLVPSPDGELVYVTGSSYAENIRSDFATIAYDAATGEELQVRRYDGPSADNDFANDLAVSPDGAVYVTGASCCGRAGVSQFATVAYGASLQTRRWVRRYDGHQAYSTSPQMIAVGFDGATVYVVGATRLHDTSREDYATVAYEASSGAKVWERLHNGPFATGSCECASLAPSPDGRRVYVAGLMKGDYFAVAYRGGSGGTVWDRRYGHVHRKDVPSAVGTGSGEVYLTGSSRNHTSGYDYFTVAAEGSSGLRMWARRYAGPDAGNDSARAMAVPFDGSAVFVTGVSPATTYFDIATVRYATH